MEERTGSGLVFSCRCQVGVQHQGLHMGRLPRRHGGNAELSSSHNVLFGPAVLIIQAGCHLSMCNCMACASGARRARALNC